MIKISLLVLTLSFLGFSANAQDDLLQTKKRDKKFTEFLSTLDLGASNTKLTYKSGTTSVGLKILVDDPSDDKIDFDYKAYWMPNENGAANSQAQVVTYFLGRFLDMSELVLPSDYLYLEVYELRKFEELLMANYSSERGKWKIINRDKVLEKVRSNIKNNKKHFGAISMKKKKFSIDAMVSGNTLKSSHPLTSFIRADKAAPSKTKIFGLREVRLSENQKNTSTEHQLARDLSRIMILDALAGQWDRFSGGNLEARFDKSKGDAVDVEEGRIRFFARDNGGANVYSKYPTGKFFKKYLKLVTRFDRDQVEKLKSLNILIDSDPEKAQAVLRTLSQKGIETISKRVKALLNHIESQVNTHGETKAYFQ